jgi:hypothetical protein
VVALHVFDAGTVPRFWDRRLGQHLADHRGPLGVASRRPDGPDYPGHPAHDRLRRRRHGGRMGGDVPPAI